MRDRLPLIVTTTCVFPRGYPAEKAIDRIAAAGFDALDMGLDYWEFAPGSPFMENGYLDWAHALRERAENKGVRYTHAHAPGGADCGDIIGRSLETAAALGAESVVLHPAYREENGEEITDPERFIRFNAELTAPWIEKAEKLGVTVLSENLQYGPTADPRMISALVKQVGSPRFGWCFDVGHAHCSGFSPEILRECEVPLSLHLHDNDGEGDDHLIPGDGTVDWEAVTGTLREIGYAGDCVMEAHHQCKEAPDETRDGVLARLYESAVRLRGMIRG